MRHRKTPKSPLDVPVPEESSGRTSGETPPQVSANDTDAPFDVSHRRILAIHLPRLLSEVVTGSHLTLNLEQERRQHPFGIVLVESSLDEVKPTDALDAVDLRAHRAGLRAGQTINEARALVADLQVEVLEREDVEVRLIAVAEVVQRYGMTVAWGPLDEERAPDTVWVDTTGVAHLFGGEEEMAQEVQEQVRLLGHVARVALAAGPTVAQAIAKFGGQSCRVVPREETAKALGDLPVLALPLSSEKVAFLSRLGLFTVDQLRELPPKTASARLGDRALEVLALAQGIDRSPLEPGEFPRSLVEEIEWEDPAYGLEPLLFALRGLLGKLGARLRGRGEACSQIGLCLSHDQAIARHRGVLSQTLIEFELSTPLWREGDLERVLKSRLSKVEMKAPTLGLKLTAEQLSPAPMDQVGLSEAGISGTLREANAAWSLGQQRLQELAVLLAELEADVGEEGLGTLGVENAWRPEARSVLQPVAPQLKNQKTKRPSRSKKAPKKTSARAGSKGKNSEKRAAQEAAVYLNSPSFSRVTRLARRPHPLHTPLAIGASFAVGPELYTIESLRFIQRLDGVEWWTPESTSRDYFWAWIKSPRGGSEALLFVDRNTQETYLQAWGD